MANIKSFTDISQSKKLAEILPLKSADMYYARVRSDFKDNEWHAILSPIPKVSANCVEYVSAWSLSALLDVLIYPHIEQNCMGKWVCRVEQQNTTYLWEGSNPVDSCYEMVLKLNEQKLL